MRVFTHEDVVRLLPMQECIDVMEEVLADLAQGCASQPLRSVLPLTGQGLFGLMPAYLERQGVVGAKLLTIFSANYERGLPSHQGLIALFDGVSGAPLTVVDAQSVTEIRTAAVSGVASRWLARKDASEVAILGAGQQARTHIEAMFAVRPITRVRLWSRRIESAQRLAAEVAEVAKRQNAVVEVFDSARTAVDGADIICTVTAATTPILEGDWVKPGAHINAVGACRASDRELDTALVQRARLYVDRRESAQHEAGDILIPIAEGAITEAHIMGELGDLVVSGAAAARGHRTSTDARSPAARPFDGAVTVFESLGLAVEDLAAACFVYKRGQQA